MEFAPLLFSLAVAALALYYVAAPFLQKEHFEKLRLLEERERLNWKRQFALQNVKELDFDLKTGKLGKADHAALRGRLLAQTVALTQELKTMDAAIEDKQIELEIQKRRKG